jgi:Lrp/AsnC family transcriptional regulator for asnA, asnC and gidA
MPKGIDELDRDLLRILQRDARASFTSIAEELGKPDTTVHFRVNRLKDSKTVSRFSALFQPEAYGFNSAAIFRIQIGGHILPDISKERASSFAEELAEEEHYLWVAIDSDPTVIHALVLGADGADIEHRRETLAKSPDVLNIDITSLEKMVKGWEISGKPE